MINRVIPANKQYPLFRVDTKRMEQALTSHTYPSAKQTIQTGFATLNLDGVASLPSISCKIISEVAPPHYEGVAHKIEINFIHEKQTVTRDIGWRDNFTGDFADELWLGGLHLNLPRGQAIGRTLITLALLRCNTYANREMERSFIRPFGREMLRAMAGRFSISIRPDPHFESDIGFIGIPEISFEEIVAIEWYWRNILHCPPQEILD